MNANIDTPHEEIEAFCKNWQVTELALFGSVLTEAFGPASDVDVMVRFAPNAGRTLFDIVRMEEELSRIFGRRAELVERAAVESSRNYVRRAEILRGAEALYAA